MKLNFYLIIIFLITPVIVHAEDDVYIKVSDTSVEKQMVTKKVLDVDHLKAKIAELEHLRDQQELNYNNEIEPLKHDLDKTLETGAKSRVDLPNPPPEDTHYDAKSEDYTIEGGN